MTVLMSRHDRPEGTMVVAGRWFRVSGDKQDEQNQYARVDGRIAEREWTPGKTYVLPALSASKREQAELIAEAIADMRSGLIDCLVMRHTDRIDRTEELGDILREVRETGGWIESVEESWVAEVSGLGGKVMTGVTEWMNAEYVRKLSANVKDAQAARRAAGSYASGTAPRGYTIVGYHSDGTEHPEPGKCPACYPARGGRKTLIPNDDAAIIKRIFTAVAKGDSYLTVARALQADKVPTRGGSAWGSGVIGQIVRNPTYRGLVQYKPEYRGRKAVNPITYMTVEEIVTATLWRDANNAITERARGAGRGGGRKSTSLLKPTCGRCGGPMYVYNRDPRYARYRCAGLGPTGNTAQGKPCGNTIKIDVLDREVIAEFEAYDKPEIIETVISGSDYAEEIAQIQLAVKDLDMLADDYDDKHAELVRELRRLRSLPAEPAKVVQTHTGRSEGDAFKAMGEDERKAFIRLWTLTVMPEGSEPRWTLTRPDLGTSEVTATRVLTQWQSETRTQAS